MKLLGIIVVAALLVLSFASAAETNENRTIGAKDTTNLEKASLSTLDKSNSSNIELTISSLPPEEEWNKTFDTGWYEHGHSVQQTLDGGYIVVGTIYISGSAAAIWLIKTDSQGKMTWNDIFDPHTVGAEGYSVQQTNDGGYIIAGERAFDMHRGDVWLIKIDSNGKESWIKVLTFPNPSSPKNTFGNSIQQTNEGGYIVCGWVGYDNTNFDVLLTKTDPSGNPLWNKTFGGINYDAGNSVQICSDGGYIIVGETRSYGAGRTDVWLIKTDKDGNKIWDKTFGGASEDVGYSTQQTSDGGYIITGSTSSYGAGSTDVWLIKTDKDGNKIWDKTFGGANADVGRSVQLTGDVGYIIAGANPSNGWLIQTDSNGNKLWDKTFGKSGDKLYSVQWTRDGSYIITGYTSTYAASGTDLWLIKVAASIPPGKAVLAQNPTFAWDKVGGSTWYYLWVDGPSGNVIKKWYTANEVTSGDMCYAMPSVNLASGSYTWWIQTWNDAGYGPWSEPRSFSVATPEKCQLISPSGSITSTQPTYQWNPVLGSTWYYLWLNGPSGKIYDHWYTAAEVASGSVCQITPALTLTPGSSYTWRIQTWNDAGYGPWSDSKSFTVS